MKSFTDRLWLVLLGVAVAILVTLTTIFWTKPSQPRSAAEMAPSTVPAPQALLPRLGTELARFLTAPTINQSLHRE